MSEAQFTANLGALDFARVIAVGASRDGMVFGYTGRGKLKYHFWGILTSLDKQTSNRQTGFARLKIANS
jgi:hypothetical protein